METGKDKALLVGQSSYSYTNGFTNSIPVAFTDCNVFDYDLYDPYYYNDYCANNYWCIKTYNADCSPQNAYGLTSF